MDDFTPEKSAMDQAEEVFNKFSYKVHFPNQCSCSMQHVWGKINGYEDSEGFVTPKFKILHDHWKEVLLELEKLINKKK